MWRTLKSWLGGVQVSSVDHGTPRNIATHLQRLIDAPVGASLIIAIDGRDDAFLQFTADADVIQIDKPLLTVTQMNQEATLQRLLSSGGFKPYESRGSDGSRFLDCDVPRDAAITGALVNRILVALYGVDASSQLRFIGNGLPPVAA